MNEHTHILLLHNAGPDRSQLIQFLESEGYRLSVVHDGMAGLNQLRHEPPDLILLDAELKRIDGITLCGTIRKQSRAPIILITHRADEIQHVIGLDRGADLCLPRPFSTGELRARIRSLLRRTRSSPTVGTSTVAVGKLRVDGQVRRAWLGTSELQLTPREFELLAYLMQHRGVVITRDQLLRDVWGGRVGAASQTIDVHIRWLRQKIERNPEQPEYIRTVRMVGYRLEEP